LVGSAPAARRLSNSITFHISHVIILLCLSGESFQINNVYAKKCLSTASNDRLQLAQCSYGLSVFFEWTVNGKLKGAYSGYQNKCIQQNNNISITMGNCSSNSSITWACKDRTLKTGDWYLSWNIQADEVQVTKIVIGREALWVLLDTDNGVCDWPARATSTTSPFIQPTTPPRERHSGKCYVCIGIWFTVVPNLLATLYTFLDKTV
jgi:hypothetical protein